VFPYKVSSDSGHGFLAIFRTRVSRKIGPARPSYPCPNSDTAQLYELFAVEWLQYLRCVRTVFSFRPVFGTGLDHAVGEARLEPQNVAVRTGRLVTGCSVRDAAEQAWPPRAGRDASFSVESADLAIMRQAAPTRKAAIVQG